MEDETYGMSKRGRKVHIFENERSLCKQYSITAVDKTFTFNKVKINGFCKTCYEKKFGKKIKGDKMGLREKFVEELKKNLDEDRFGRLRKGLEWQYAKDIAEQLKRIVDSLEELNIRYRIITYETSR